MERAEFQQQFSPNGKVAVFPVIHVLTTEQAVQNVAIAIEEDCAGVFLINHDFEVEKFLPIIREVRAQFPGVV